MTGMISSIRPNNWIKSKKYLIYCKSGIRSEYFMGKMKESGFDEVYAIQRGYVAWQVNKLPLES